MKKQLAFSQKLLDEYLKAGDTRALEVAFVLYKRQLFSVVYRKVHDVAQTHDIIQETFIKAYVAFGRGLYREDGKLLPWLLRVAGNLTIDFLRRGKKLAVTRTFSADQREGESVVDVVPSPDLTWTMEKINSDIKEEVKSLIDYLPEEQRDVVIMRMYLGMSFKEIAEHTEVSINTSLGRMRYALINLRKLVKENHIDLNGLRKAG